MVGEKSSATLNTKLRYALFCITTTVCDDDSTNCVLGKKATSSWFEKGYDSQNKFYECERYNTEDMMMWLSRYPNQDFLLSKILVEKVKTRVRGKSSAHYVINKLVFFVVVFRRETPATILYEISYIIMLLINLNKCQIKKFLFS